MISTEILFQRNELRGEQMDYEYYYNNAKSRYYDACSEINSKGNRISELKNEKNRLLNEINGLRSEITKYTDALKELEKAIKMQDDIERSCDRSQSSIDEANINFGSMAESSSVSARNLNDAYKTDTRSQMNNVFESLGSKRSSLNAKIAELEKQKNDSEAAYSLRDSEIRNANSDIAYWESVKNNSSIDMEYYKRKMEE